MPPYSYVSNDLVETVTNVGSGRNAVPYPDNTANDLHSIPRQVEHGTARNDVLYSDSTADDFHRTPSVESNEEPAPLEQQRVNLSLSPWVAVPQPLSLQEAQIGLMMSDHEVLNGTLEELNLSHISRQEFVAFFGIVSLDHPNGNRLWAGMSALLVEHMQRGGRGSPRYYDGFYRGHFTSSLPFSSECVRLQLSLPPQFA